MSMKAEEEKRTEEKRASRFGVSLATLLAQQDLKPFIASEQSTVEIWKIEQPSEQGS